MNPTNQSKQEELREQVLKLLNRTYYPGMSEITPEDAPFAADTIMQLIQLHDAGELAK